MNYKKSEITKDCILEAASKLFLEKGYAQTTIRDICKESGVSLSRVNYHFSTKSELALIICRKLLKNFYAEMKQAIQNDRGYSLVAEAVALRFLVDLIVEGEDKPKACLFYRDCARDGLFGEVFNSSDRGLFQSYMSQGMLDSDNNLDKRMGIYSQIFGSSLSAISKSWKEMLDKCGGNVNEARKEIQDVFAALFLQMMDIPHDAQKAMVEMSYAYYKLLDVRIANLTDVVISIPSLPSLKQKVNIIEPIFEDKQIKLKSKNDRKTIDVDVEKPER